MSTHICMGCLSDGIDDHHPSGVPCPLLYAEGGCDRGCRTLCCPECECLSWFEGHEEPQIRLLLDGLGKDGELRSQEDIDRICFNYSIYLEQKTVLAPSKNP